MGVQITTATRVFQKLLDTNATDASFPSKVATTTEPDGDGVLDMPVPEGSGVPNNLLILPFGAGADNTTFDMRVIGWKRAGDLWIPVPLAQVSCTLSAAVGVSGELVTDTDRFADTITLATGFNSNVSVEVVSPTNDIIGHVVVDAKGFAKIEMTWDMTGATSGNALWVTY